MKTIPQFSRPKLSSRSKRGFIVMEVIVAVFTFGIVGTALVVALNDIGNLSFELQRKQRLARILDNELRRTLTIPNIEEGTQPRSLSELQIDLETVVTPIEGMENEDGQLLANMFRIQVTGFWFTEGVQFSESVESWRYARLYQQ